MTYAGFSLVPSGISCGYLVTCEYSNHSKDTCLTNLMYSHFYFDSLVYCDSSYLLL